MTPQIQQEIIDRIDALAAKLGTTAQFVWGVLVKQAKIELIKDIMGLVLSIAVLFAIVKFWVWANKKHEEIIDLNFFVFFGGIIATLGGTVFFVASVIQSFDIPTLLLNPQYWALQQMFGR